MVVAGAFFVPGRVFAEEYVDPMSIFEPGTTCLKPEDPRLAVICGVVRSATPRDADVYEGTATNPNPPLKGVSVYIYECYPDSPTCKKNGALANSFSSTFTDENGYYTITMRKVGNNLVRYLAFVCGGKLGGLFKVPSYASFNLNVPVNCPDVSNYSAPAASWDPVNYSTLSCDITRTDPDNLDLEPSYEGKFGTEYQPVNEYNFWLEIDGADGRYKKYLDWLGLYDLLNKPTTVPTKGAFYHEDCFRVYNGNLDYENLCYFPKEENLDGYEKRLYNDPALTTANFLPNIPIKNSLLFFKDLTARQDVVNYAQNPTATAQLLHTIFSNCKGNVYLRNSGGSIKDVLPECDDLKACNSGISETSLNYRNRQYSAGPAKNLANPAILQDETAYTLDDSIKNTYVCQRMGTQYKIGDIQPPWSYCKVGESNCPYKLDKLYWNPEFAYFFGEKGTSTKVGYGFEGSNDSFWPPASGTNEVVWKQNEERAGVPIKGGTYYSDNNYGYSRNNGLTPMMAGIATTELSGSAYNLTYVLQRPFETNEDKLIYEQGIVKIEDAGSNLASFCENSNVNDHYNVFPPNVADAAYVNTDFKGNADHYFEFADSTKNKGELTPTSTIFYTTASKNREIALKSLDIGILDRVGRDVFDSYLTATYGGGKYGVWDLIADLIFDLFSLGGHEHKSYFDRDEDHYNLSVASATLRDDLKSTFSLSEENFEQFFFLPDISDGTLFYDEWGKWFDDCYQRNEVDVGKKCYNDFGVTNVPTAITRTCRVELCELVTLSKSITCEVVNGVVVRNDGGEKMSTEPCATTGITADASLLKNAMYYCATEKKDCYDGSWDKDCLDLRLDDVLECPDISEDVYFPGDYVTEPIYMGGMWLTVNKGICSVKTGSPVYWYDFPIDAYDKSCEVTVSASKTKPGCNMQDAGPYLCAGSTHKDANFKATQETFRINTTDVPLDSTKTVNNEIWKKMAHPFSSKTYDSLAFQSANTSVSLDTNTNVARNKNKDTVAFGGASPEYKMISAHPLYTNYYDGGEEIFYHCINSDGLSNYSGDWNCPLLEVPDPEIIDLFDDSVTNNLKSACQLNTSASCISSYDTSGVMGAFNPTFIRVLDMAASEYDVPAALILAYLAVIHKPEMALYQNLFSLSGDQALFDASAPWYGRVPRCDDTNIAAIGPYDWIAQWFPKEEIGPALDELSDGRSETASRCNFLDATYAAAYSLRSVGTTCESYTWDIAKISLLNLTLGFYRTEDYNPDSNPDTTTTGDYVVQRGSVVWNSCR